MRQGSGGPFNQETSPSVQQRDPSCQARQARQARRGPPAHSVRWVLQGGSRSRLVHAVPNSYARVQVARPVLWNFLLLRYSITLSCPRLLVLPTGLYSFSSEYCTVYFVRSAVLHFVHSSCIHTYIHTHSRVAADRASRNSHLASRISHLATGTSQLPTRNPQPPTPTPRKPATGS
jgi:hypothetical protein